MHYFRAIIIVHPHGTFIINKSKSLIIKSIKLSDIINKPLLLIQNKFALGIIYLNNLSEINLSQFNSLKNKHLISDNERKKWWPNKKTFYTYHIYKIHKFSYPIPISYPIGPQVLILPHNVKPIQKIYIGTSGYDYDWPNYYHNNNKFDKYISDFNSLELNGSYYRNFSQKSYLNFKNNSPPKFLFSVKVNRSITLYQKFNLFNSFWNNVQYLSPKLGCLLFQFSHNFVYSIQNLNKLLKLNISIRSAFEFRHPSWFNNDVYNFFKQHKKWTFVITCIGNEFIPNLNIGFSNFIYIRFHGSTGKYTGSHVNILNKLIKFIRLSDIKLIFIYFNNTDSFTGLLPDAIRDAKILQKRIGL